MDSNDSNKAMGSDIPKQIVGKFLDELKSNDVPIELIGNLESILLNKETVNEADIKTALFSDIIPA